MKQTKVPTKLVRIQFEMPQERVEEMDCLMKVTGTATKREYLNDALTLYELAIAESRAGRRIAIIFEDEEGHWNIEQRIVMSSLSNAEAFSNFQKQRKCQVA